MRIPLSLSVGGAVESPTMIDTNVLPQNIYLCESELGGICFCTQDIKITRSECFLFKA